MTLNDIIVSALIQTGRGHDAQTIKTGILALCVANINCMSSFSFLIVCISSS